MYILPFSVSEKQKIELLTQPGETLEEQHTHSGRSCSDPRSVTEDMDIKDKVWISYNINIGPLGITAVSDTLCVSKPIGADRYESGPLP